MPIRLPDDVVKNLGLSSVLEAFQASSAIEQARKFLEPRSIVDEARKQTEALIKGAARTAIEPPWRQTLDGLGQPLATATAVFGEHAFRDVLQDADETLRSITGAYSAEHSLKELDAEELKRRAKPILDWHRSEIESAREWVEDCHRGLFQQAESLTARYAAEMQEEVGRLTRETTSPGYGALLKSMQMTLAADHDFSRSLASQLATESVLGRVHEQLWQQHSDTLASLSTQRLVDQVLEQVREHPASSLSSLQDIRHWIDNLNWDALADAVEPDASEPSREVAPSDATPGARRREGGWASLPLNLKWRLLLDVITLISFVSGLLVYYFPKSIEDRPEPAVDSCSAEAPAFELWVLHQQEPIRARPNAKAASVVVLPNAALVRVLDERRGWLLVEAEAGEGTLVRGWIPKKSARPLQEALLDHAIEQLHAHDQEPQEKSEPTRALAVRESATLPAVIAGAGGSASQRYAEFFAASIRNRNTRAAYWHACSQFLGRCEEAGLTLDAIQPVHVAGYVEHLSQSAAAPTVKQHLAAIRRMFDFLVVGQILPVNPAASVRGPKHVVSEGKTPILDAEEVRTLFAQFDETRLIDLRDRAILGAMVYSFARVGALAKMRVKDYYRQGARAWFVLDEKGGKQSRVPAHHQVAEYIEQYLTRAGIEAQRETPLFRSLGRGRGSTGVTQRGLRREEIFAMVRRRTAAVGLPPEIGCHSFRGTGITNYLKNGGTIETAAKLAGHASTRTTQLYDRRSTEIAQAEIERIRF